MRCFEVLPDDWNEVIELNLNAVFFMSQRIGKSMAARHYGKIINIASMDSFSAVFWFLPTVPAKAELPS